MNQAATFLGGDETWKVTKAADGTVTSEKVPSTEKEKWGRIAAAVIGGALKGMGAGQGPGGAGKALAAGGQFGMQIPQQQKQNAQDQVTQDQKQQTFKANMIKLQQDHVIQSQQMQDNDIKISKELSDAYKDINDRVKANPNNRLIGKFQGVTDLPSFSQQHPEAMGLHGDAATDLMPIYNADHSRWGSAVYHIDPSGDSQPIGKDAAPIPHVYADPETGDTKVRYEQPNAETTQGNYRSYLAAQEKINNQYYIDRDKADKDKVPTTYQGAAVKARLDAANEPDPTKKQGLLTSAAQYDRLAAEHQAAGRTSINTAPAVAPGTQIPDLIKPGGTFADGTVAGNMAYKLAHHEATLDDIPKRYGKGQLTPQDYVAGAEAISQRDYNLPYNPTMIKQEEKMFDNLKTQGTLDGIDKMIGVGNQPGYLDTVVTLANKAGITDLTAPIQDVRRAIKTRFGDSAMKDFNSALSEVQRNLPTLIGNPLIGGSDSDLKQKAAQKAFGEDVTLSNLKSNSQIFKTMMQGSKESLTRNNRFLQDRYGLQGPGGAQQQQQPPPTQPQQPNTSQAARQPGKPLPAALPTGEVRTDGRGNFSQLQNNAWVPVAPPAAR
jgi:hypothetical protein